MMEERSWGYYGKEEKGCCFVIYCCMVWNVGECKGEKMWNRDWEGMVKLFCYFLCGIGVDLWFYICFYKVEINKCSLFV